MTTIPRDTALDSSLALLRDGNEFILKRHREYRSDVFETRLLGQTAICLTGESGTQLFYDTEKFQRAGALPKRVLKTVFGERGVQTLDDATHRQRKAMFMSLMTPWRLAQLVTLTEAHWQTCAAEWQRRGRVELFTEVLALMSRVACAWSGVPLAEAEVGRRADQLWAMVDGLGGIGPRYWRGVGARLEAQDWIGALIEQVRGRWLNVSNDMPLAVIAWHEELDGRLMDTQVATVELLNLLRPITAIAVYITYAALALHQHPAYRQKLQTDAGRYAETFVQEVRRFYPFAPFLGARVRNDFDWQGYRFKKGTLTLLDIYGTNRDPRLWENPEAFWPERFEQRPRTPFDFIPQGGGDYHEGHRCAGEWITVEALKVAASFLVNGMTYHVPKQDLRFSLMRMPTLPRSKFVISNVRRTGQAVVIRREHDERETV